MIVFLDDEPRRVSAYVDTLAEAGWNVSLVDTVDEFFRVLSAETTAVIIDVMLDHEIDGGLRAFNALRRSYPRTPAILLTNRNDMEFGELDTYAIVLSKRETLPHDLLEALVKILPQDDP